MALERHKPASAANNYLEPWFLVTIEFAHRCKMPMPGALQVIPLHMNFT